MEEEVKRGRGRPRKDTQERVQSVNEVTGTQASLPVEKPVEASPARMAQPLRDDRSTPGERSYVLKSGDDNLSVTYHIKDRTVTLWKNNSGINLTPQEYALFVEAIRKFRGH